MRFCKSLDSGMVNCTLSGFRLVLEALTTSPSIDSSIAEFLCLPKWMVFDEIDDSVLG